MVSSSIVFPASDWGERELDELLPLAVTREEDGTELTEHRVFELQSPREVSVKGLGRVNVREIYNTGMWFPMQSAEQRARESLTYLDRHGRYWPRWDSELP